MSEFRAHGALRIDNQPAGQAVLTVTVDEIDVTAMSRTRPNMAWSAVDPSGHFHAWAKGQELPTLDRSVEIHEVGVEDEVEEVHYACKLCGWEVRPAYITETPPREVMPGRRSWGVVCEGPRLAQGAQVSIQFSGPRQWFGLAQVVSVGMTTRGAAPVYVATLGGIGPLGERG